MPALVSKEDGIVTTGTGASDFFHLPDKENGNDWSLVATSETWGDANLQTSADGTIWFDVQDCDGAVNFTVNRAVRATGNMFYRLNVSVHSAAISLVAK